MSIPEPGISFVNENAILLAFDAPLSPAFANAESVAHQELQWLLAQLARRLQSDTLTAGMLREVVPGPGNLLLVLRDGDKIPDLLQHAEALWQQCDDSGAERQIVEIPVVYGGKKGPDLPQIARHTGLTVDEIIHRHGARIYTVECLGFMAGFAYLGGMDPTLAIPRKKTPAARIPAGAVAIGGHRTGIYPSASPGGWHIIGETGTRMFDPAGQPPCLLQPGDRVRFVNTGTSS